MPAKYQNTNNSDPSNKYKTEMKKVLTLTNKAIVSTSLKEKNDLLLNLQELFTPLYESYEKHQTILKIKNDELSGLRKKLSEAQNQKDTLQRNTAFYSHADKARNKHNENRLVESIKELEEQIMERNQLAHPNKLSEALELPENSDQRLFSLIDINLQRIEELSYSYKKRLIVVEESQESTEVVLRDYGSINHLLAKVQELEEENEKLKQDEKIFIHDAITKRRKFAQMTPTCARDMITVFKNFIKADKSTIDSYFEENFTVNLDNSNLDFDNVSADPGFKEEPSHFESTDFGNTTEPEMILPIIENEDLNEKIKAFKNVISSIEATDNKIMNEIASIPNHYDNRKYATVSHIDKLAEANEKILGKIHNFSIDLDSKNNDVIEISDKIFQMTTERKNLMQFYVHGLGHLKRLTESHIDIIQRQNLNKRILTLLFQLTSSFGIYIFRNPLKKKKKVLKHKKGKNSTNQAANSNSNDDQNQNKNQTQNSEDIQNSNENQTPNVNQSESQKPNENSNSEENSNQIQNSEQTENSNENSEQSQNSNNNQNSEQAQNSNDTQDSEQAQNSNNNQDSEQTQNSNDIQDSEQTQNSNENPDSNLDAKISAEDSKSSVVSFDKNSSATGSNKSLLSFHNKVPHIISPSSKTIASNSGRNSALGSAKNLNKNSATNSNKTVSINLDRLPPISPNSKKITSNSGRNSALSSTNSITSKLHTLVPARNSARTSLKRIAPSSSTNSTKSLPGKTVSKSDNDTEKDKEKERADDSVDDDDNNMNDDLNESNLSVNLAPQKDDELTLFLKDVYNSMVQKIKEENELRNEAMLAKSLEDEKAANAESHSRSEHVTANEFQQRLLAMKRRKSKHVKNATSPLNSSSNTVSKVNVSQTVTTAGEVATSDVHPNTKLNANDNASNTQNSEATSTTDTISPSQSQNNVSPPVQQKVSICSLSSRLSSRIPPSSPQNELFLRRPRVEVLNGLAIASELAGFTCGVDKKFKELISNFTLDILREVRDCTLRELDNFGMPFSESIAQINLSANRILVKQKDSISIQTDVQPLAEQETQTVQNVAAKPKTGKKK